MRTERNDEVTATAGPRLLCSGAIFFHVILPAPLILGKCLASLSPRRKPGSLFTLSKIPAPAPRLQWGFAGMTC